MALPHLSSGQITRLDPLDVQLSTRVSSALFKSTQLEVVRLLLPAGDEMREHQVAGEITLQCLEGKIELTAEGRTQIMSAGDLVYLDGHAPHSLRSIENASLLLTICLSASA